MDSEYRYFLLQKAAEDLENSVSYIAVSLSNPQAAAAFRQKVQNAIAEACRFPESGAPVENEFVPQEGIRKKLVGNYAVYYLPKHEEKTIYVLRVIYARRNPDEIYRELNPYTES